MSPVSLAESESVSYIASGVYDGVDWKISNDYELVIGRVGRDESFHYDENRSYSSYPWDDYRDHISSVRIEGTVRGNGNMDCMFAGMVLAGQIDLKGFDTSASGKLHDQMGS